MSFSRMNDGGSYENAQVRGEQQDMTDPRQLSGGERSYSTLAFFLAVGKEAETPFCCADEFDVFMDVRPCKRLFFC